jgi:hypothetical protein
MRGFLVFILAIFFEAGCSNQTPFQTPQDLMVSSQQLANEKS